MKKLFIISVFIIFTFNLILAQNKLDAIYHYLKKEYTLTTSGELIYKYTKHQELITNKSYARLFGETPIIYNTINDSLHFNYSYTINPDGDTIYTPFKEDPYKEYLPHEINHSSIYNNYREFIVHHLGLEPGAIIYFEYEKITKNRNSLFTTIPLADFFPIDTYEIVVRIPENKNIVYNVSNSNKFNKPIISTENGYKVIKWKLHNIPLIEAESHHPDLTYFVPTLYLSTIQTWEDAKKLYENILYANDNIDPALYKKFKQNVEAVYKDFTLTNVVDYIKEYFDEVELSLETCNFNLKSCNEVLQSMSGTIYDKQKLIVNIAKKEQWDNFFPILLTEKKINKESPNLNSFDIAGFLNGSCELKLINKELTENPFHYKNYYILPFKPNANISLFKELKIFPENLNIRKINKIFTITKSQKKPLCIKLKLNLELQGIFDKDIKTLKNEIKSLVKGNMTNFSYFTKDNITKIIADFDSIKFDSISNKIFSFNPNIFKYKLNEFLLPERNIPVKTKDFIHKEYTKIKYDNGIDILNLFNNIKIDSPFSNYSKNIHKNKKDLIIEKYFEIKTNIINPNDYKKIRKSVINFSQDLKTQIYFKVK